MSFRSAAASALAILAAAHLPGTASAQASASEQPPVQAIWKQQQIPFYFQSFRTFYSCDSLEAKVRRILIAVGANRELNLRTTGCFAGHEIARTPRVEISIVSAVEATPEALAERERTRSTRELIARARGETEEARRAEEQFLAEWRQVTLSRGRLYLDQSDCELIDQLKDKVFPKLGVRVVEDGVRCGPHPSTMQPRLVVEALFELAGADEPAVKQE